MTEKPQLVTIVGSVDNAGPYLAPGEQMTVVLTEHAQGLINKGEATLADHSMGVARLIDIGRARDATRQAHLANKAKANER